MNIRIVICIAMGVLVAHIAVLMIVFRLRFDALPPPAPTPEPNFSVAEKMVVDPETGQKTIYRDIHVSTQLADPPPPETNGIGNPDQPGMKGSPP